MEKAKIDLRVRRAGPGTDVLNLTFLLLLVRLLYFILLWRLTPSSLWCNLPCSLQGLQAESSHTAESINL